MTIEENVPLAPFTTLKIGGDARYFTEATAVDEIKEAVSFAQGKGVPFFILGGGSNILVSDSGFSGLVIKISLRGISHKEEGNQVFVTVGAGEVWDKFVEHTVKNGWRGIENLSGIPGTVGAAPIQNIGAYGVEVGNLIEIVSAIDSETGRQKIFTREECGFSYRESFFKSQEGKKYVVTSVSFRLSQNAALSFAYHDLENYFRSRKIEKDDVLPGDLRFAVLSLRESKLPPLKTFATAGCFFKNPFVSLDDFARVLNISPDAPHFGGYPGVVKIPAGFLVERSGDWKGIRRGDAGVYEKHALVLINYGSAKAKELNALAKEIEGAVRKKFGVILEPEVNFIGEF